MDEIEQSVDAARQRLVLRQWAGRLALCLTIAFGVAFVAILAPKVVVLPNLPASWATLWLAGAVLAGVVAASVWTAMRRKTRVEAAVEIDQRYNLRERIASSLTLSEEDLATPAGAALLRDARRAIAKVEVAERFKLGLDRGVWRPLAPALAALLIATLVGNRTAQATVEPSPTEQVAADEAKKAAEEARKQLAKRRQEAEEKGLADASALLKKVEEGTAELAKKEAKDPAKAAVKLNGLSRELAERRDKLGGGDELRNQLNRMRDIGKGPADKAADAMKQGDWQKAMDEIAKVREQLAGGDLPQEKKDQLAAQLGKMQQQLGEATQQHQQQKQDLERQLAEAQRQGDLNQAGKLQQKLDQLGMKQPQMERLQQLAQQMQQAKEAMEAGDPQQAADAMQQMAQQMDQMAREDQEMRMLDAAMADIMGAKEAMGMEAGDKPGDQAGQMAGNQPGMGQEGQGQNQPGANGRGMGRGRGDGSRNTEKDNVSYRDTQVRQDVGRGSSTFGGLVDGPTVKGDVVESIKTPLNASDAQPADPLTSERLPKSRREHAEEYFRGLRDKL
ncbi:hypothetical protein [Botrimarina mediterranea]|uniref:hypothetical protein n=1 Tax=Botrimarina mediterranea TaxID=2528022 RepID=UPI001189415B|nr:hypothetical protein K2D_08940 [Planctomycetes bacterium K2D]